MFLVSLAAQASLYDSMESVETLQILAESKYNKDKDNQRKIANDNDSKTESSKEAEKN